MLDLYCRLIPGERWTVELRKLCRGNVLFVARRHGFCGMPKLRCRHLLRNWCINLYRLRRWSILDNFWKRCLHALRCWAVFSYYRKHGVH